MTVGITLDTRVFRSYVLDLQRKIGGDLRDVVRAEVGSILKTCLGKTRMAKTSDINVGASKRASRDAVRDGFGQSSYDTSVKRGQAYITYGNKNKSRAGTVWFRGQSPAGAANFIYLGKDGNANRIGQRFQARAIAAASMYASLYKKYNKDGLLSRALARNSWVQIADAAGIRLEDVRGGGATPSAIAKARLARPSNGKVYRNGDAFEIQDVDRYALTILNTLPYAISIGMDKTLQRVIAGRVKQFERLIEKGYINSAASVAQQYPNQINIV